MAARQTQGHTEKIGFCVSKSLMDNAQHLEALFACLLYRIEQRGEARPYK